MREYIDTEKVTFCYAEELPDEGAIAVFTYPIACLSKELQSLLPDNKDTDRGTIIMTITESGDLTTVIRRGKSPHPFMIENDCAARLVDTARQHLENC